LESKMATLHSQERRYYIQYYYVETIGNARGSTENMDPNDYQTYQKSGA
jgi:hypothetical protein